MEKNQFIDNIEKIFEEFANKINKKIHTKLDVEIKTKKSTKQNKL